jgi:hypothetical protein
METGKSLIKNPAIVKHLAESALSGRNFTEIAEDYGVHPQTISKAIKSQAVREQIEKTYNDIVGLSSKVFDVYKEELDRKMESEDARKLRFNVAKEVASISGISPVRDSRNSVFLQQILAPTQINISPLVSGAIDRLLGEVVDVEPEPAQS